MSGRIDMAYTNETFDGHAVVTFIFYRTQMAVTVPYVEADEYEDIVNKANLVILEDWDIDANYVCQDIYVDYEAY
jgi:hypothetical protein